MKLFKLAETFRNDEDGAVTVDWVVLTAAVVGLGIAIFSTIDTGLGKAATAITADITEQAGVTE